MVFLLDQFVRLLQNIPTLPLITMTFVLVILIHYSKEVQSQNQHLLYVGYFTRKYERKLLKSWTEGVKGVDTPKCTSIAYKPSFIVIG